MSRNDIDNDTLVKAAEEALTRPESSMWNDPDLFDTFGLVHTWADRSDDVLSESNHYALLDLLQGVATEDTEDSESDDVRVVHAGHWAVGSVTHIFVRVSVEGTEGDIEPTFTEVFKEAVHTVTFLREEYPILDESDYSDRQWAAMEHAVNDEWLSHRDLDTTHEEDTEILRIAWSLLSVHDDAPTSADDIDTDVLALVYRQALATFKSDATALHVAAWDVHEDEDRAAAAYVWADYQGLEYATEERFRDAYSGVWASLADYVAETVAEAEDLGPYAAYISWKRVARDWEMSGDVYTLDAPGGDVFVFNGHA